ncbi:MAG: hypothetical protein KDE55_02065 [Novosphingobium sp.]|nr:hypothetical protein [Novosphingobium sp.]
MKHVALQYSYPLKRLVPGRSCPLAANIEITCLPVSHVAMQGVESDYHAAADTSPLSIAAREIVL